METSSGSSTSSNPPGSQNSRFKSSDAKGVSPIAISGALHLAAATALGLAMALGRSAPEVVDFEVIESPKLATQPQLNLNEQPKPVPPRPAAPERKVFGVSRKAVTTDGEGVSLKAGNTVATAPDNEKLLDSDADSLPIPTDEYLISKMPSVASEITIPYPPEARAAKIEGKVVIEVLIDATGRVREAKIAKGLGYGLDEAALKAIYQFKFRPAEVDGKPVAVRIPFTYNFVLKSE